MLGDPFGLSAATPQTAFFLQPKLPASVHIVHQNLSSSSSLLTHSPEFSTQPAEERQHSSGRPLSFFFSTLLILSTTKATALTLFPIHLRLRACPKFLLTSKNLFGGLPSAYAGLCGKHCRTSAHRLSIIRISCWTIIADPNRHPLGRSRRDYLDITSKGSLCGEAC